MDIILSQLRDLGLVTLAALLAGLLGLERELASKPAGFRTNMIIGGASALLVILGETLTLQYSESPVSDLVRSDPLRIFEAIIVGISFIGAGTILKMRDEERVRYLTTAASILFSAAIGISVALEQFVLAVGATVLILAITYVLNLLETRLDDPSE